MVRSGGRGEGGKRGEGERRSGGRGEGGERGEGERRSEWERIDDKRGGGRMVSRSEMRRSKGKSRSLCLLYSDQAAPPVSSSIPDLYAGANLWELRTHAHYLYSDLDASGRTYQRTSASLCKTLFLQ